MIIADSETKLLVFSPETMRIITEIIEAHQTLNPSNPDDPFFCYALYLQKVVSMVPSSDNSN